MAELIGQVDPAAEHVSVCNNATWAAGEIALKHGMYFYNYREFDSI